MGVSGVGGTSTVLSHHEYRWDQVIGKEIWVAMHSANHGLWSPLSRRVWHAGELVTPTTVIRSVLFPVSSLPKIEHSAGRRMVTSPDLQRAQ